MDLGSFSRDFCSVLDTVRGSWTSALADVRTLQKLDTHTAFFKTSPGYSPKVLTVLLPNSKREEELSLLEVDSKRQLYFLPMFLYNGFSSYLITSDVLEGERNRKRERKKDKVIFATQRMLEDVV